MSAKFKEVKNVDFPKLELEILEYWKQNKIFEKSLSTREDGIPFTFYEGPPTANGKPGIHHVLARTVKDLFCRYKTIKGFRVNRKAGWDTHGLPVEIEIEKELGLKGREEVEAYGIAEYNKLCRESVLKYKHLWDDLTKRMGYWVDLENPYVTFENDYIESVWWALGKLYEKDLLYRGHKIQWYSPGSGTVLSSHEVSLGYENVQDPSVYIKFQLDEAPDTFFLAWTTTPWTLISNMLLAVHKDLTYVLIRPKNDTGSEEYLILVKDRLEVIDGDYEVIKEIPGSELVGKTYKPVFDYALKQHDKSTAWRVIDADFVTTEDGTGIVHLAPAFGADDYAVCQKHGIPLFNPVSRDGKFDKQVPDYEGMWFKDADKLISRNLRERGLLYKHETYLHNYPHDWRKGTPLMSYPVESWFIRTTAFRDRMVELNKGINWKPESTGTGRFGTWLENNVDWAISRQRFWGTPLPIWINDRDPKDIVFIGSVQELREKAGIPKEEELDLHRPYIDEITWTSDKDGGTYRRIPDLVDVWLDSGAMPFCQWHYPFENNHKFKENFPADFIAEGVDQTRGWFYTLHALSTMLFDKPAYQNVVSNGLVLDAKGNKMSKSKGNTVDPFEVIRKYGADTVRWYMMSNTAPWENLKFSEEGLNETQRKFFNTIMNTYSFLAMYANIDGWSYAGKPIPIADRSEMDRWIISRMFTTVKEVDIHYDEYEPTRAAREIEQFVEDLSNWYIRRSRRRFWREGKSLDKTSAYQTLFECLFNLTKLMSPLAPFFSDWLYRQLNVINKVDEESVHLSFYPTVEETSIDKALEYRMKQARIISSTVLRIRNKISVNVRQPLARIILPTHSPEHREAVERVKNIILDEVNVKELEYVDDDSGIVHKSAKPNYPVVGSRLGKKMKAAAQRISGLSNEEINEYESKGTIDLDIDGEKVSFGKNDILVVRDGLKGWEVETEEGVTVAADTNLTDSLIQEGLAREIVNRVQNMRKEANFDVTDRIRLTVQGDEIVQKALDSMAAYIKDETLSEDIINAMEGDDDDFVKEWEIDDKNLTIAIKRKLN